MLNRCTGRSGPAVLFVWIALVGLCGCTRSGDAVTPQEQTLSSDSGGVVTVPVPERIANSRIILPSDLSLSLVVILLGVDENSDGADDTIVVNMSARDADGNAQGLVEVPPGIDFDVNMIWRVGEVTVATRAESVAALTESEDREVVYSGSWNYTHDDDQDTFINFEELSLGTDPSDSGSVPLNETSASILAPVVGLWDLTVFDDVADGDIVALRINPWGTVEVVDYSGDEIDNMDDCSAVSQRDVLESERNVTFGDGFSNRVVVMGGFFPFEEIPIVHLDVVGENLVAQTYSEAGDLLEEHWLALMTIDFNTDECV